MTDVSMVQPRSTAWVGWAIDCLHAEANRAGETNLLNFPLPTDWGVSLYFKDESAHPTGSLKHRLARSLFIYGICNGWIHAGTTVVEASSGSTAVSEAYFASLLGLRFVAVVPDGTSQDKIVEIERYGGRCHYVDSAEEAPAVAEHLARELDGHYMDQFRFAERASDWKGPDTIAQAAFRQLEREPHPEPSWIVVGAGTGGTAATFGRFVRWTGRRTKLCVVDPPGSVLSNVWRHNRGVQRRSAESLDAGSVIEGIGRPRAEESFLPWLVDSMLTVPDGASVAALSLFEQAGLRRPGGSTGANLVGAFVQVAGMVAAGERGSVLSVICDSGERYGSTLSSLAWVAENVPDVPHWTAALEAFVVDARLALHADRVPEKEARS